MFSRLLAFFRRGHLDHELNEEVRFHLGMLEDEFHARGLSAEEARLAARREFGAVEPMKEVYRDRRGIRWLNELMQDLRYGLRGLRRNPGFTVTAVLSLAVGIGVNAAIFAFFYALLLQMLPVQRPQELVSLYRTGGWGNGIMSLPLYQDLRDQADVFKGVLARESVRRTRLGGERAQSLALEYVSGNYFSVLGIRPATGRMLTDEDAKEPGASPVAVLSYDAWRSRFGLDPHIVGRSITLDDKPFTVIGIAQAGFRGVEVESPAEVWEPLTMSLSATAGAGAHWLWTIARRKPGVPDSKIQAEVNTINARYLAFHYGQNPDSPFRRMAMDQRIELRPGGIGISLMRAEFEKPIRILMGAVLLILLIACANVAGLLLARGAARRREMAIRFSLGAGRWRLVRQWLTESAVLATAGASLGWMFTAWAAPAAARLVPGSDDTEGLSVEAGGAVLLFTAAAAIASALLFGIVAGLGSTSVNAATGWRESSVRLRLRLRRVLVAAQVALAVVLVVPAGLFIRSLAGLTALDLGFRNHDVLTFWLEAPRSDSDAYREALPSRFLDRVSCLPGIISASAGFPGPYQTGDASGDLFVPGVRKNAHSEADVAQHFVYPHFFETIGCSLLRGREFNDRDRPGSRKVAVVNQAFAKHFLPGQDPVDSTVGLNSDGPADVLIVGLVRDMQHDSLRKAAVPSIYLAAPQEQRNAFPPLFLVRASVPQRDLLRIVRREAAMLDPALTVEHAQTLQQRIDRSIFQERMLALVSACFGTLALALAGIGIYGVISFVVTRRSAEIGVRVALGAQPAGVVWMVLREAMLMVIAGVLIGVPVSLAGSRMARGILYGIQPGDPGVVFLSVTTLFVIGVTAAIVPALRAARIDPMQTLRSE